MRLFLYLAHFIGVFLIMSTSGCGEQTKQKTTIEKKRKASIPKVYTIQSPIKSQMYTIGDSVKVQLRNTKDTLYTDNILLITPDADTFALKDQLCTISTKNFGVGSQTLKIITNYGDTIKHFYSVDIHLLSDVVPRTIGYDVIKSYPHNTSSFTQGLVFEDGNLYEGTGQYGESKLKYVNLETGKDIKSLSLPREFFGEGICVHGDKIYQLTWKAQTGFIYDKNTFEAIQKFSFSMPEGWGLTSNGKNFILSDGTNRLYFIEPEYFTETHHIDVCDDEGIVRYLNELEYIDGYIYANIWGDKKIAIIEPKTGKVTGYLNLENLIPKELNGVTDKVLNGIAYNNQTNTLFVTGKYWPVLYEIKLK